MKFGTLRSTRLGWITIAFVSLAAPALAQAATYYVDQASGSDANAGTSQTSPWANAPGMSAYRGKGKLVAGDTVFFRNSGTWLVTGTQGIYLVGGVKYVGNGWGTGSRARLKAAGDLASAVVRFSDHATIPTVFQGFDVDANGKVANGVEMNHSFYAGPLTGAVKRVDNVVVHNVWSRASMGQYKYGVIVSNHGGTAGEVANVEILNSTIRDISRDGLPIYPGDSNANCIVRNVVVRGNTVYNTGQDPDYAAGSGIVVKGRVIGAVIENNYVYKTKGAGIFINGNESNHFGYGPSNIHVRYNIVNVNTVNGSIRLYDGSSGGDPKDVSIYGNLVYNNTLNGGLVLGSDLKAANTLRVYNNTFYNAPVAIEKSSATFPVFEFRNNLVHQTSGVPLTENGKFTAHSNNAFSGSGTLVRSSAASYSASNLASYESSAVAGDPKFVNPSALPTGFSGTYGKNLAPNAAGLALQSTSALIDRGVRLASPYNGSVNTLLRPAGKAADISAYELPTTTQVQLSAPSGLRVQ